jgi:hypothetical protein
VIAPDLTLPEAARMMREAEAVRDKSYRQYPLGQEWGRFLRAKRLAGCEENTLRSYETVGRRFALRYADFDSLEPFAERETGPELVLDFLDHFWGEADRNTLDQRTSIMRSFFEWAYRTDRISADPMRKIEKRRRKQQGARRQRIPAGPLARLVSGQESLRDQAAILLLGRLGLRREDLRRALPTPREGRRGARSPDRLPRPPRGALPAPPGREARAGGVSRISED